MPGITLAQAQAKLDLWMAADDAVAGGQSYSLSSGGMTRSLTKADSTEIQGRILFWDNKVKQLTNGGSKVRVKRVSLA